MNIDLTGRQFARTAAVAFAVSAITVAVIQSQRSKEEAVLTPTERRDADAVVSELARCRTITPDDLGLLESCRHIWAENRQHFFLSTKSLPSPAAPAPYAPPGPAARRDGIPPHDVDRPRAQ
jgi:conjugative transfer region protein TrbK